jgi:metallophosphoesterase (TIGR00282 family)
MRILFIGDILSTIGKEATKKVLPKIKEDEKIDFVIANGEHLANRVGISAESIKEMQAAGIDFFTTGNHVFRQRGFSEEIEAEELPVIRPANFLKQTPGKGFRIVNTPKGKILIINLLGQEGIQAGFQVKASSPFEKIEEILKEVDKSSYDYSLIDFHADLSSEKVAMGRYLDGRVSAVVGTHTHVPTADARVLKGGTAVVSDVGFVGPMESVLGVKDEIIFKVFTTGMPQKFELADGEVQFNSVVIDLGENGKALDIKRLDKTVII